MLLIYLPVITSRCEYIFALIFKEQTGIPYQLTNDTRLFKEYQKEKINYSFNRNNEEFYIHASSFLFDTGIYKADVPIQIKSGITVLFDNDQSCDMGFDIFAATFYMISRYEEYLPFEADKYGRFKGTDSLAYRNRFLQQPVVDIWIGMLKEKLLQKFPYLQFKPLSFNYIFTYDIDIAYAFLGRSVIRNTASGIKDLTRFRFKNILNRLSAICGFQKDPWDVYDFLADTVVKKKVHSIFFFLLGDYSRYDKNISPGHPLMKKLITRIATFSDIGIHPSYKSSAFPKQVAVEKKRLAKLSGKKITKSRQHFLNFSLPVTYNHLIDAGIEEDYSMGFADVPGFRAGTCKSFYFYDLTTERSTSLRIFPITVMEGSFINYLKVTPAEALDQTLKLIEAVKSVNGTFVSIWHNHTLSESDMYKGWRPVHDKMIEYILSNA